MIKPMQLLAKHTQFLTTTTLLKHPLQLFIRFPSQQKLSATSKKAFRSFKEIYFPYVLKVSKFKTFFLNADMSCHNWEIPQSAGNIPSTAATCHYDM